MTDLRTEADLSSEQMTGTVVARPGARDHGSVSHQLITRLVKEMQQAWEEEESPRAEAYLARHPQLFRHPDAALRLIYEEIELRARHGDEPTLEELAARFPQWQEQLAGLLSKSVPTSICEPPPPVAENTFANFELVEELGHGSEGRVYLGKQLDLANRLVVLKVTAATGAEHLCLARLQHTNIVPLFGVSEDHARRQRALCMPFFGRATLKHILQELGPVPVARRVGKDILAALDRVDAEHIASAVSPSRALLGGYSYVEAVCWIGAALADALHYAHERDLLHLDVKPSNVLLASDGQPMLLDFNLARAPLELGEMPPLSFGGTPAYMSPEQQAASSDVWERRRLGQAVDARTDIFGLGMVLYEALAGETPTVNPAGISDLRVSNPQVSIGLADIVRKCLAWKASQRYSSAAALAADLRRHLNHQPLREVRNRSWRERWQKWRRRRPFALPILMLMTALIGALGITSLLALQQRQERRRLAEEYFFKGRDQLHQRQFIPAKETLAQGRRLAEGGNHALARALEDHLRLAERAAQADRLHHLADSLRYHMLFPSADRRTLIVLDVGCRQAWEERGRLLDARPPLLEPLLEERLRRDLNDLAIGWADVRVRLATPAGVEERRKEALALLTEAQTWGGCVPLLEWQRYTRADDAQSRLSARSAAPPATAWEHYTHGRCLFRASDFQQSAFELEKSLHLEPGDFYANFSLGVCAARLDRHAAAVAAFSVCIGRTPGIAEPFVHRGRAYAAMSEWQHACSDFERALLLRPNVPDVLLERGQARFALGLLEQARQDLRRVLDLRPEHPGALLLQRKLENEK